MLSKRIQNIAESQTLAINTLCQELQSKGEEIYNFSVGEPDIYPPELLSEKLQEAFQDGYTKYTNPVGLIKPRETFAAFFSKINKVQFTSKEIALTSGGKQALFATFQVLLNPNDEVIVITPYWVSYLEQIKLAGGKSVLVKTDKSFQLDVVAIKNALSKKTKAIIFNTPNNPTGAVFKKEKIIELAQLLEGTNIYIITDDVYQPLVYEGEFYQIASYSDTIKKQTIIIQSFSKSYSMTGLRLGAVIATEEIINAVGKFQGHASGNPTSIIQIAVSKIPGNVSKYEKEYIELFRKRKNLVLKILSDIPNISFVEPEGALYFFVDISKIEKDAQLFTKKLLQEKHVALVPGDAFGQEGFVRITFASSDEKLIKGLALFKEFCESYK